MGPFFLKKEEPEKQLLQPYRACFMAAFGVLNLDVIYWNENSGGIVSEGSIKQMSFSPGEFTQPSNQFQI